MMEDEKVNATIRKLGEDPDKLIDVYIDTIADAVRGKPAGMTIGMHLCRGNYKGRWLANGGYGRVAERVFNIPGIDIFLMEYDSPRAGDFSPLKHLPKGKTVILGLISSARARSSRTRTRSSARVDEASKFTPLEQLGISPQCGFATNLTGRPLTVADERAKLSLVVEIAREMWN